MVIYFRKEGRALGEVTKYLVYNARMFPYLAYISREIHEPVTDTACFKANEEQIVNFVLPLVDPVVS